MVQIFYSSSRGEGEGRGEPDRGPEGAKGRISVWEIRPFCLWKEDVRSVCLSHPKKRKPKSILPGFRLAGYIKQGVLRLESFQLGSSLELGYLGSLDLDLVAGLGVAPGPGLPLGD